MSPSSSSPESLNAFLSANPAKSPEEALGPAARGNLIGSLVWSTLLTAVVLAIASVIPYMIYGSKAQQAQALAEAQAAAEAEAEAAAAEAEESKETEATDETAESGETPETPADPVDRLGVTEAREAPSDVNPLENSGDDLFRDLGIE